MGKSQGYIATVFLWPTKHGDSVDDPEDQRRLQAFREPLTPLVRRFAPIEEGIGPRSRPACRHGPKEHKATKPVCPKVFHNPLLLPMCSRQAENQATHAVASRPGLLPGRAATCQFQIYLEILARQICLSPQPMAREWLLLQSWMIPTILSNSKDTGKTPSSSSISLLPVIGEEIRKARKRAGLSQEELAFRSKCTRNYISLVELNQHSPTLDTLIRICHALGVRASTLVDKVEGPVGKGKGPKGR